jgi:hypothetical protein
MAIIANIIFPGVGSFLAGKGVQGFIQLILFVIGLFMTFTGLGAIIGIPLCFIVWIWGIITVVASKP